MITETIVGLNAEFRYKLGKNASRRLRSEDGKIPAIIYGGTEVPKAISLMHNKVLEAIKLESFYSNILTLDISGKKEYVVLKDIQRHPYKLNVLHMDFQRVRKADFITMSIPLHFTNESICPGVKKGGIINYHSMDVEIRCQVDKLPKFIEVDLSKLELHQTIHLSELKFPAGVEVPRLGQGKTHDLSIVNVNISRLSKTDEEVNLNSTEVGDDNDAYKSVEVDENIV